MGTTDERAGLDAAFDTCALFDRTDTGRLLGSGPDLLDLVHRLGTGAVQDLAPGTGKPTVLTTPKGRIAERLFVQHLGEPGVLLTGGAGCADRVIAHLDRYTFAEQTGLRDITGETFSFVLIGPDSAEVVGALGVEPPAPYQVATGSIAGRPAHLLGQDGFDSTGFTVTGSNDDAGEVRGALAVAVEAVGGGSAGRNTLEAYRILRGLPAPGHELTDDYNPLEAGLDEAVSFDKGCYVGQEVVARLRTYDKVSRSIVGLRLQAGSKTPGTGTALYLDARNVGTLTSTVVPPGETEPVALAYVKRKTLRPDLELQVGENGPFARVVELPFPRS